METCDPRTRRKWPRKYTEFPVLVKNVAHPCTVVARVISAAGIGLESSVEFSAGDFLQLQFCLPGEQRTLLLNAVVISVREDGLTHSSGARFQMGLKFINCDPGDQNYLMNYMSGSFLLY